MYTIAISMLIHIVVVPIVWRWNLYGSTNATATSLVTKSSVSPASEFWIISQGSDTDTPPIRFRYIFWCEIHVICRIP